MGPTFLQLQTSNTHFCGRNNNSKSWAAIVASYMIKLQQHPAKKWLLYEPDSFTFSALFYALLAADKSVVLPQNAQPEHINAVKQSVDASIGDMEIAPTLVSNLDCDEVNHFQFSIPYDAVIFFYTSGSTGAPKVIKKKFRSLQREVDVLEKTFSELVSGTVFMSTVPHQHIYGLLFKTLWPISKGHRVICQAFEYPEQLAQSINAQQRNVSIISSPAQLHRLAEDNPLISASDKVKSIFSSGGPLDGQKNLALQDVLACKIIEVFGSTETGGIGWRHKQVISDNDWQAFVEINLSYQPNSDLLAVSSPYIEQPIYNADDRVEILANDRFRVIGRADSVVKIEEKRISLDEVQERIKQHEYVDDAFVVVIGVSRRKLAAMIVLNKRGIQATENWKKIELNRLFKGFLANWYEPLLLPKKYRYPTELPYNARGKLSRLEAESYFD